jgi:hypothetical protein
MPQTVVMEMEQAMTYELYLANTRGQKLSAISRVEAPSFAEARAILRRQFDAKGIDRASTEVLGVIR